MEMVSVPHNEGTVMKHSRWMGTLLVFTAATSFVYAQQAKPASTPAAPPASTRPTNDPAVEKIMLHVTGLTKDNQTAVRDALNGLGREMYVCPTCKHEETAAGKCPTCKVELQSKKVPSFETVTVALDTSSITLVPAPNRQARLSHVEQALKRSSVQVDESRLALPGSSTLILEKGTADGVPVIEKALKASKLFEDVQARFDAPREEIDVQVRAGALPPTRTAVAKAIEATTTKARLADVVWGRQASKS